MEIEATGRKVKQSAVYTTLWARNLATLERHKEDFYATEPKATELLLEVEKFKDTILEPACWMGHISEVLKKHWHNVISYDLIDRWYGETKDCFDIKENHNDVISNPPYKIAREFIEHLLDISDDGVKVAMFLKIQFLEWKARKEFFKKYPPKVIYVSSSRLYCAINGDFSFREKVSSAVAYGWFIWEKGFTWEPTIRWIN